MNDIAPDQVRAMNSRFLRHAFDHLSGLGIRTGAILLRNGLLKGLPKELFSAELVEVLKSPSHARRLAQSGAPYVVFHEGERKRGLLDLSDTILNPVDEIRRASLAEIDRQVAQHEQLISPQTKAIIESTRGAFTGSEVDAALGAGIRIADALNGDFFFAAARLRQCSALSYVDDVGFSVRRILLPSLSSLEFLHRHPFSNKEEATASSQKVCVALADNATTLEELLDNYFFHFGFVPLGADFSAGSVYRSWRERGHSVEKLWESVWQWAKVTGSFLADYHACQVLCSNTEVLSESERQNLADRAWEIVIGETKNERWRLRVCLARHFLRHFELSAFSADGERAAVFSWWLAEYAATLFCTMTGEAHRLVSAECDAIMATTAKLWHFARPAATPSRLRTATLYEPSPWSRGILVELGNSRIAGISPHQSQVSTEVKQRAPTFVPLPASTADYIPFAFDGPTQGALCEFAHRQGGDPDDAWAVFASLWSQPTTEQEQAKHWNQLLTAGDSIQRTWAGEVFRQWASLGIWDADSIWQTLGNEDGRYQLLGNTDAGSDVLNDGLFELMWRDTTHEWRTYLPHYFALAAQDPRLTQEQKCRAVNATIVTCLATNSCSAIERLQAGKSKTQIGGDIEHARKTLDDLYSQAPPWLMARFRAVRAAFQAG